MEAPGVTAAHATLINRQQLGHVRLGAGRHWGQTSRTSDQEPRNGDDSKQLRQTAGGFVSARSFDLRPWQTSKMLRPPRCLPDSQNPSFILHNVEKGHKRELFFFNIQHQRLRELMGGSIVLGGTSLRLVAVQEVHTARSPNWSLSRQLSTWDFKNLRKLRACFMSLDDGVLPSLRWQLRW